MLRRIDELSGEERDRNQYIDTLIKESQEILQTNLRLEGAFASEKRKSKHLEKTLHKLEQLFADKSNCTTDPNASEEFLHK